MEQNKKFGVCEKDWMIGKYHCLIIFTRCGVYNGYIGVPKNHFLYGKSYRDKSEKLKITKDVKYNGNIMGLLCSSKDDTFTSPDNYFCAHCGFTYSGNTLTYDECKNDDFWYFGFDCNHCFDGHDYDKAFNYGLISQKEYDFYNDLGRKLYDNNNVFRDFNYVYQNILSIVEQLGELDKNNGGGLWV